MNPKNCKPPKIVHNKYNRGKRFKHSLTVDGEEGHKVDFDEIACNGNFRAVTSYFSDYFPRIFLITDFTSISEQYILDTESGISKTTKII